MNRRKSGDARRVLAVASGGGHWTQLLRLAPAFDGCEVVFASTMAGHADSVDGSEFVLIRSASRSDGVRALLSAIETLWLLVRIRPDVVVTTGALPGLFTLMWANVMRRRTIWIDSVANASELSMSGRHARRFADVWLTQWEHLAHDRGPHFAGSVIN